MDNLSIHGNYPIEELPEDHKYVMDRVRQSLRDLEAASEDDFQNLARLDVKFDQVPVALRVLESRLTFRLSVLSKLLDQQAEEMLEGTGITLIDYRVLNLIYALGDISITDISRFCAIERAEISKTAAELANKDLVAFEANREKPLKKNVALTESGRDLLQELHPVFLDRNRDFEELLGPDRRRALGEAITLLTEISIE